ncbi:hypothetical protein MNBD_GAMMA13-918 [hydrothermal vent metagenome]|uniref:Uncharacterized protein n=1 Tax=hydrothermal vent metagenome TaxID=652676 RepID=A0A3B0Z3F9_9ZZZZ
MQNLAPQVWYLDPDCADHGTLIDSLSASELAQYRRFHFPADAHRYLVAHAMVRHVLSRYAPVEPAEWLFSTTTRGKPKIANPGLTSLQFNLTHTHSLVACVISFDQECGIDAEHLHARNNPTGVAKRMFSPMEYAALMKLEDNEQLQYFYRHWTLREAYVKARGIGLSFPTNKIQLTVHSNTDIELCFDASIKDQGENWMLRLWQIGAEHILAMAVAQRNRQAAEPVLHRFDFSL